MARNVVFVGPVLDDTMRFARALAGLADVRLLGVVPAAPVGRDARLYYDLVRVTDPFSAQEMLEGVAKLRQRHGEIHTVLGVLERLMVPLAELREQLGIPGTPTATAVRFRDKAKMKAVLRRAGLPVSRSKLISAERDARLFAAEVGFPIVVKPPAGVGTRGTLRVDSLGALLRAVRDVSAERPLLAEEMLHGTERTLDTLVIRGVPRECSIAHYIPTCLEAVENPWIQWVCFLPRDISGPEYDGARAMGAAAIRALGFDDGMTHMEWFRLDDGRLAIGEIAQRPPAANITRMIGLAHDVDAYRAWARATVDREVDGPWTRKHAVGCVFLRGPGQRLVAEVTGLRQATEKIGAVVVESRLPVIGAPKSDGYEGDGYIIVRGETDDEVKLALKTISETVSVRYTE